MRIYFFFQLGDQNFKSFDILFYGNKIYFYSICQLLGLCGINKWVMDKFDHGVV